MNKLPEVIAITEFKQKKITRQLLISELNMEGYNIFTQDLSDNKGRGVLFYIASDIPGTYLR